MKIERIETFLVAPRWLFCRVETDDGLVGWGEPVVEGRAEVVRSAVEVLSEYLIGADPLRIEQHWQVLTKGGFYRGGPILSSAVAGLDQALWDIAGQAYGAPVHALLGGHVRDRVRIYSWIGGDEPGEVAEAAAAQVAAGLTGVKMNACGRLSPIPTTAEVDAVIGRVAAAREVLGPDRDIAVDFHGRAGMAAVRRILPELAALRPFFVEEPVLPDQAHHLRDIVASTPIPVATGERLYGRSEFLGPLQAGVAVVQPDLSHAGGISEVRRIAALAETYGALLAPHCPLGPISLAASLQVAFATPNFLIQEQSIGIHYNAGSELLDYLVDPEPFRFVDGHIARLDRPGLGITVDEVAVRKAAQTPHAWRNPVWQHADGSFAEW
ncbi:galactonate dehydratase [Micromonospora noduli]|uniref:Galactonate dehydratase n=1 Tax=Micromonospora noduli TaxID=709876 RepID=A0ABX9D4X4_9ACTN|nr:galactonate dehydratase [Micromonospora noduli]KAB1927713.1 galactonate dehydratase [Micromonospora noduli]RAO08244.1 Galactonate dehydratase [Micromonospora noduli]RAO16030.1 Galactonate dehydratase [Micromonospora noduli]RAO21098.1 Galactonate dehydratase [Micromonospora noduli]RAO28200.1 Galactonate dehydratase [Micromonospora noduli]